VGARKAHKPFFAFRRQPNVNFPAVGGAANPLHQSAFHHPVCQSDRAVMLNQQGSREISHRRAARPIERPHGQQELVLLWFEPVAVRGLLAELQKAADLEAKIG
jgi:hypothetical protein